MLRPARESDAQDIARIYNQAIEDKLFATCDVLPVTVESRIEWLASHEDPYPAFVLEDESQRVIGWSALNRFSVRPCYPGVAELSVYVDREHRQKLAGGRLFMHTLKAAKRLGFRSLVSLTLERNEPSIRGLMAAGFRRAACLNEVAQLHGEWVNVVWLQKELSAGADDWEGMSAFMERLGGEPSGAHKNGGAGATHNGGAAATRQPSEFGIDMHELTERLGELPEQSISYYENNRVVRKSFPDVSADVKAMQARLESWGVAPGMRVGILSANSYQWIVCDLALLRMRCICVSLPLEENAHTSLDELAEKYSLHLLMISARERARRGGAPEWAALLDAENAERLMTRRPAGDGLGGEQRRALSDPDLLTLIFSSGTSGKLKCVLVSKCGTEKWIAAAGRKVSFRHDDSLIVVLPLSHYQQRLMVFTAVWYGFSLILSEPARLLRTLKELKPTILAGPPPFYETVENRFRSLPPFKQSLLSAGGRLINLAPSARLRERLSRGLFEPFHSAFGGRVRLMLTGGAPSRRSTLELFKVLGLPLYQVYGLVETGFVAVNLPGANRLGSVGKPMFEGEVEIAPDGEIIARYDKPLALGYLYCDEGEEKKTFLGDNRIATGDIGRFDEDGFLYITGRKKQIIITPGGYKVQPELLETEIERSPDVARAVVFGGGELSNIVALVSLRSEDTPQTRERVQEVVEKLNEGLPGACRVRRVVFTDTPFGVDNGFLTRSLKVNRPVVYAAFRQNLIGLE